MKFIVLFMIFLSKILGVFLGVLPLMIEISSNEDHIYFMHLDDRGNRKVLIFYDSQINSIDFHLKFAFFEVSMVQCLIKSQLAQENYFEGSLIFEL